MSPTSPTNLSFGDYLLDRAIGRLRKDGAEVELRPKSFDVLHYLATHAGRLVTKDELLAAMWPGVVVTDDSLVQCIGEIRRAIQDSTQEAIRTVPRRGYVFTPTVTEVTYSGLLAATAGPTSKEEIVRSGYFKWTIICLTTLIFAGAFVWVADDHVHWPWLHNSGMGPPLSIVVLPLTNLSADSDAEILAEGLTEDLTTDLSRIPSSFVIARSSAYSYQGKSTDVRKIGSELGVRYVLEGSTRRIDDIVRLNVRLVDAETGKEIWADRFDRNRRELGDLQRQVTGMIARTLHLELIEAESSRSQRERAANPDAYDLALRGWSLYERRTPQSVAAARENLLKAVTLDPRSTFGWSLLSDTYTADLLNRWMRFRQGSFAEWLRLAEEAASTAYEIDPDNLYAVGAKATVLQIQARHSEALALFEKQLALNRNYAPAWHRISYAYVALGKPDAAIAAGNEAVRLSPRDGRLYSIYTVMAAAYLHGGQDAQALEFAEKAVRARSDFGTAYSWIAAAAANLGDIEKARAAVAEFRRLQPDYTVSTFRAQKISEDRQFLEQHERYYAGLLKAGLPE